jgi:ABC-type branched-subunit amino acid transport system ATPase component/ABC-type branched-subunit amino acid transport system permease subunit
VSPVITLEERGPSGPETRGRTPPSRLALLLRRGVYAIPLVLLLLVPSATSGWSQRSFVLDLGGQIAIFAVILLGLTVLYGWTGQIALGHAAFVGLGAYTTAVVDRWAGAGFQGGGAVLALEELAAVVGICALAGIVVGLPAVRISGLQLVIITFGAGQIFLWFLATYSSFTGGDQGLFVASIQGAGLSTVSVTTRYVAAVIIALLLTAVVGQIRRSPAGHAMQAVRHSELAAESVGIHPTRVKLIAFVMSSVLAGVGGWLYAHQLSAVAPGYFDTFTSIFLLAAILIGGNGTLFGAWLGAAYLIGVPEIVRSAGASGNFYTGVSGVLLVTVVVLAPEGLADLFGRSLRAAVEHLPGQLRRARRGEGPVAARAATPPEGLRLSPGDAGPLAANSLRVEGVNVAFSGVPVLSEVTVGFDATCINGVIGPNGAGKTTLLNVVTGFVTPASGAVLVNGRPVGGMNSRDRAALGIGRTFQTPRLLESESVEMNILLGRARLRQATLLGQSLASRAHRRSERRDRDAVRGVAARLGLTARDLTRRVSNLPAGTRRLVEFGRVLAMEPTIILLDEPIAGLDVDERQTVADVLTEFQVASQTLIVVIEHDVDWVRSVCGHLVVLDAGRVLVTGTPSTVLGLDAVREAYFGLGGAALAPVGG